MRRGDGPVGVLAVERASEYASRLEVGEGGRPGRRLAQQARAPEARGVGLGAAPDGGEQRRERDERVGVVGRERVSQPTRRLRLQAAVRRPQLGEREVRQMPVRPDVGCEELGPASEVCQVRAEVGEQVADVVKARGERGRRRRSPQRSNSPDDTLDGLQVLAPPRAAPDSRVSGLSVLRAHLSEAIQENEFVTALAWHTPSLRIVRSTPGRYTTETHGA